MAGAAFTGGGTGTASRTGTEARVITNGRGGVGNGLTGFGRTGTTVGVALTTSGLSAIEGAGLPGLDDTCSAKITGATVATRCGRGGTVSGAGVGRASGAAAATGGGAFATGAGGGVGGAVVFSIVGAGCWTGRGAGWLTAAGATRVGSRSTAAITRERASATTTRAATGGTGKGSCFGNTTGCTNCCDGFDAGAAPSRDEAAAAAGFFTGAVRGFASARRAACSIQFCEWISLPMASSLETR